MSKVINFMKKVVLYLWQLPQNLLGLLVILFSFAKHRKSEDVWITPMRFGVSLGNYIIVNVDASNTTIAHEKGHQKQSLFLGPLYLLVVGLPLAARNVYDRIAHKNWSVKNRYEWCYGSYPEDWADKLGHVPSRHVEF